MKETLNLLKIDRTKGSKPVVSFRYGVIASAVTATVAVTGVVLFRLHTSSAETSKAVEVGQISVEQIAAKTRENASSVHQPVLMASGYIVPRHKYTLGSKVTGKVAWAGVEEGETVVRSQLLIKLEDQENRALLQQAKAGLQMARINLGELMAGSRPEEIERGKAEFQRVQSDLENARVEYERSQRLEQYQIVSQKQADDARTRFQMADALARSTEQHLKLLVKGPRKEQIEQAKAKVEQAKAAVAYAQTMLDATEIRAPVSGTIINKLIYPGEVLATSYATGADTRSAAIVMADLSELLVEINISQSDFSRLSGHLLCTLKPEAFPDRSYGCVIDTISPEGDRHKGSILVRVKVLNPDNLLKPEMSATVTFLEKEKQ